MKLTRTVLGALGAGLAALALAAPGALAAPHQKPTDPAHSGADAGGAVFVQTDGLTANSVVAYKRSALGRLTKVRAYPTGGRGGQLAGSEVDHLASQGSLALDEEAGLLFAVNAGSDTITEFAVEGTTLKREAIVPSGGEFPASVAVHGETL